MSLPMTKYKPHPKMPHKAEYLAVGRGTGSSKAVNARQYKCKIHGYES